MELDRKGAQVMFVCMYVSTYMFVCFSEVFSRLRALTVLKVVPYGRVFDNTLLRHIFSPVVFPATAWHVIMVSICLTSQDNEQPSRRGVFS